MKLNPNDPITPEEQDVLRKAKDYFSNGGQSDPQVLKSRLQETLIEYRKRKSPQAQVQVQPVQTQTPAKPQYDDTLGLNPRLAAQTLRSRGADNEVMQSASYKLKNSADTLKAQAGEAALSGKTFDVAKSLAQTVPIVGSAWTLGEKAVGVADTTGRLGREQATAHFEDRTSNLTDAFWNENNAGNDQHFHQALDQAANEDGQYFAKGLKGVSNAAKYVGTGAAYANPITLPLMVGGGKKYIDPIIEAGSDALESALVDPSTYISAGYGAGGKSAALQVGRALERSGVSLTPQLATQFMRLSETLSGPEYVSAVKTLFTKHGGDLRHLEAIAGTQLEQLGNSRLRVGLPFAMDKAGFEPGAAISGVVNKLSGGKVSLPENLVARGAEAVVKRLPGNYNLPLHTREAFTANRSAAVHNARANVVTGLENAKNAGASPQQLDQLKQQLNRGERSAAERGFKNWIKQHIPNAPDDVLNGAATAFGDLGKPTTGPKGVGGHALDLYDAFLNIFKSNKLLGNPAWAPLNAVEEAHKSFASGMRDPRPFYRAAKLGGMADNVPLITRPSGDIVTAGQFKKVLRAAGVGAEDLKFGTEPLSSKVQQRAVDIGSLGINRITKRFERQRDSLFRSAFLIDQLEKGVSPQRAMNNMNKVLFDVTIGHASPGVQKVRNVVKRIIPFIDYSVRSAASVPMLAAKNPAATMLPINFMRGLQNQSDRNDLPANYMRSSGAYADLPPVYREGLSNASEALGAGPIDPGLTPTIQMRGTLPEAMNAISGVMSPDALGQLIPGPGTAIRAGAGVNAFGDQGRPTQFSDIPQELASAFVSQPVQNAINWGNLKINGDTENLIGPYMNKKPGNLNDQRFGVQMQNSFNPFGLRMALTSPADIEGEKVDTYEAKSVKERLQRAKAKKRGSKQKGK